MKPAPIQLRRQASAATWRDCTLILGKQGEVSRRCWTSGMRKSNDSLAMHRLHACSLRLRKARDYEFLRLGYWGLTIDAGLL